MLGLGRSITPLLCMGSSGNGKPPGNAGAGAGCPVPPRACLLPSSNPRYNFTNGLCSSLVILGLCLILRHLKKININSKMQKP